MKILLDTCAEIALAASDIAIDHKLGRADSFILAHARAIGAQLVTLDNDFAAIPEVKILRS